MATYGFGIGDHSNIDQNTMAKVHRVRLFSV